MQIIMHASGLAEHICNNTISSTEKGEIKAKTEALKKVIIMILNGEKLPGLLMTIIRFVLPLQDHTIKKLLLVFWEIVPKTTPDGKLLQEMILVCDAYRKVKYLPTLLESCAYISIVTVTRTEYFVFKSLCEISFNFRTCSIPTSSSVAQLCVSCASWRSPSCSSLLCQQSVPAWNTATVMCAATLSWPFTPSTGTNC